jgi:hypothetical protein
MKRKNILLFLIITLISFVNVAAQNSIYPVNSPEWLVDMFFKQNLFPDKEKYFAGEMIQDVSYPTIGEELQGRASVFFRKIELGNQSGVYGITVRDNGGNANFYCYLKKTDGIWKIESIRKFQLPKFIYSSVDSLSQINNLPDSVSSLLSSLKLMIGPDEDLKKFLSENTDNMYNIIGAFEKNEKNKLGKLMNKLSLDYIFVDKLYPQCVFILVGGFERIEVGFIYSKNNSVLPQMSPERFIYVEEVLPNWYVYRAM